MTARYEICVVGGGPAGSVAALRLARLGHRVCLVERCAFPRAHVGESLTRGVWHLLDGLGLMESLFREGFCWPGRTLIRWANPETEWLSPAQSGASLLVDRSRFDALLLRAAAVAGARIFQPARARVAACEGAGWLIEITADGTQCRVPVDYLVDAAGRTGFLNGQRERTGSRTVALCGYFQSQNCPPDTLVEALPDAWCWGAPIPGGLFSAMVFLDPATRPELRLPRLEDLWRSRLSETGLFTGLSRSPLVGRVLARDATTYQAADPIGEGFVRVGEANFSLDPLSSTGVEKAMQTGLVAAIVLHTTITRPARKDMCERFYRDRQREAVSRHAGWSARFYRQVSRFRGLPFWDSRSVEGDDHPPEAENKASFPDQPVSLAARVRLSDAVRLVQEPCILGDEICAQTAVMHPDLERPVAFLEGIELAPLLETLSTCSDLAGLLHTWSSRMPLLLAHRITGWMIDNRILVTTP